MDRRLSSINNIIDKLDNFSDMKVERFSDYISCYSTGPDPQCQLSAKYPLKAGWYNFQFAITVKEGSLVNPKLYFDTGSGFNEINVIELTVDNEKPWLIYFPKNVYKLRFDPTEDSYSIFNIYRLTIARVTVFSMLKQLNNNKESYAKDKFRKYLTSIDIIRRNDVKKITSRLSGSYLIHVINDPINDSFHYQNWIKKYDSPGLPELLQFKNRQMDFEYRPLISIVLPTYNTHSEWLKDCIKSVLSQVYDNWELCIADDASANEEVRTIITEFAEGDSRVKYIFCEDNAHIAAASNTALTLATGEFVAFLDHDDMLSPLALYRIVESLNEDPASDFLYSDEDKIDNNGERIFPFFKPDWSPALLYIQNYIAHLSCIRRTFIESVNGFSQGVDGSQDYDLFLKVCSKNPKIKHLPFVLYHWRLHEQSTSLQANSKVYAHAAGQLSLERYFAKKYPQQFSHMEETGKDFIYKPRFHFDKSNKVSIIIPTKDKIEYLRPCIKSITQKSTWYNYEIIILNNNSKETKTFDFFNKIQEEDNRIKVIDAAFDFNWSKLNNLGAEQASGSYLLFLNNDISVITPNWIEQLCEWASLPEVATVGAALLYEDKTIQHAGVVVGMSRWADHIYKGNIPKYFASPFVSSNIARNVLANTGACMVIEKKKFEKLGRFDEEFIICGSDVEFGIRAYKERYFNVINAYVQLFHYESKSRGTSVPDNDFVQSGLKYEPYRTLLCDPFYNPNLSLNYTFPVCKS